MANNRLIEYWTGSLTYEETKSWNPPLETEEAFREYIAKRQAALTQRIFTKIVERAEEGDASAADWLERRGFITLPDNSKSPADTPEPGVKTMEMKWT